MTLPTRDRRSRQTFWIDDRIIDTFGPVIGQYSFGATALAVYAVLARRADRDGGSWPSLRLIAGESGASARTVHKALRLLELLDLVEIVACYERGSQRQTSNRYTLLTPPEQPPDIDPDPETWPAPSRRSVFVGYGHRAASAETRGEQRASTAERPDWTGVAPVSESVTLRKTCTLPPQQMHPPHARGAPLEGNTAKDNTVKEGSSVRKDGETARRPDGKVSRGS